jgi:hypothetical protein
VLEKNYSLLGSKAKDIAILAAKNYKLTDDEVKELKNLTAVSACPIYAGVEINRVKDIAEVHPAYIAETVTAYAQTGIRGLALSWNILDAPEENITQLIDCIQP